MNTIVSHPDSSRSVFLEGKLLQLLQQYRFTQRPQADTEDWTCFATPHTRSLTELTLAHQRHSSNIAQNPIPVAAYFAPVLAGCRRCRCRHCQGFLPAADKPSGAANIRGNFFRRHGCGHDSGCGRAAACPHALTRPRCPFRPRKACPPPLARARARARVTAARRRRDGGAAARPPRRADRRGATAAC